MAPRAPAAELNTRARARAGFQGGLLAVGASGVGVLFLGLIDELTTRLLVEAGFVAVVGAGIAFVSGIGLWGHSAFAQASLRVDAPVRLGGVVEAVLELVVHQPVTLEPARCVATLRQCEARWVYVGRSRRRETHFTVLEVRDLGLPAQLEAPVHQRLSFALPADAFPSWAGKDHELSTELVVELVLVGRPNVALAAPVTVLPEVLR